MPRLETANLGSIHARCELKKVSALIVLTCIFALVGCSSNYSASKDTTTTTTVARDAVAEAKFNSDATIMQSNIAKSCASLKDLYAAFLAAGSAGSQKASEIGIAFDLTAENLVAGADNIGWPGYGKYATFYIDQISPFKENMHTFSDTTTNILSVTKNNKLNDAQTKNINQVMSDFQNYVNPGPFGPCDIGAKAK